jgi:hypothetical protein
MKRIAIGAVATLGLIAALSAQVAPDAARILAEMRQALGGDAAIAAVRAFSVKGSESRNLGGHLAGAEVELACELPDRFVRVHRIVSPFGSSVDTDGFNGDRRIRRRDSDLPVPPDPFENEPPDRKAQRAATALRNMKHEFARLAIAMIGLPPADPYDVALDGRQTIDGRAADVLQLRSPDGYAAKLFVDASTHLPMMISWMGARPFVVSTSSTIVVPRGQTPDLGSIPAPVLPPGDPTAGMAPVEHQVWFDDFKAADGLTWPHRLTEKVGGTVWVTARLGKYKLNPKPDDKLFDPSR